MIRMHVLYKVILLSVLLIISGCSRRMDINSALNSIDEDGMKKHIAILASDEFQGRAPPTQGEEKTIQYLKEEFEKIGCIPWNGESFFQEVPVVETTIDPKARLKIVGRYQQVQLRFPEEYVATTPLSQEKVSIRNSEIVFVGYGIVAPEYDWNDYQGVDVRGKTVLILVNDPGFATQDETLFNGRAMTYYGRWTYKYEEAARQGAECAIVVHETAPAAYPWSVLENGHTGPQLYLDTQDQDVSPCKVHAWITHEKAEELFRMAGLRYDEQKQAAVQRDFKAYGMQLKASLSLKNTIRFAKTNNVIAVWPGSEKADEVVIYTAHWDHFGTNPDLDGDNIFNGAVDNATGTAALLKLAEAFALLPEHPKRSVVFLPVTAEEQGLLGSAYYANHPVYPPEKTVAVINLDALNILGRMRDITVVGYGYSELDGFVVDAAKAQGRTVNPDPTPERGSYYRSDHFSFAKAGIPAVYIARGSDHVERGREWTLEQRSRWTREHYHKPSDNYDPDTWEFNGMVQDVRLFFRVGYALAMGDNFPNWYEGTEFKARRDAMME